MRYYSADEVSRMLIDTAKYGVTNVVSSPVYKSIEIEEPKEGEEDWICEDVGLVLNELREKLDEKIRQYHHINEDCFYELNTTNYNIEKGLMIAKNILEEVAHNWSIPTDDVINRVKERMKKK